nr:hypothetical protein [uncultured Draconibacterium sp.]
MYDIKKQKFTLKEKEFATYEEFGKRVGTRMDKVLDTAKVPNSKKFQIFSCSPFILSFKKQSWDLIPSRIESFFANAIGTCLTEDILIQKAIAFKQVLSNVLNSISELTTETQNKEQQVQKVKVIDSVKDSSFINIYLKNIDISDYQCAHEIYLRQKLFNINDYNSDREITSDTWGISNFINGTAAKFTKKPFLQHKTSAFYKGVASRIQAKDTIALNKFDLLLNNNVLPNPLPIFIDKNEFKNNSEIVSIFNNEGERKFSYPQLLKSIHERDGQRVLGNYYLLNINRGVVNDFDFVSNFQYKLDDFTIENLFQLKRKGENTHSIPIRNIFSFENIIVIKIFNNNLVVKYGDKGIGYKYFDEIKVKSEDGGDEIANLILRFRKAFYDYIYKSRKQAITSTMFDEIMWVSILSDIKHDEFKDGYHTKETSVKEKLNIWFSLYNNFSNNSKNRENMANTFNELLEKMDQIANDPDARIENNDTGEFMFAAGQIIYFLLTKSKASNPSLALLEPFLQKTNAVQLQTALATMVNTYKHELAIYKDRFQHIAGQVLVFPTNENLKNYQRYLLAGYFAPSAIYKSNKEKEEQKEIINN